ncbi:MAG TPA: TetR/AcrR family transcriptional regulator [Aquabacterium sp.]|uniref:TetR/AcrR family transcriptional regulator n=1 Tax=Aquabacterium sp. TaxID=1872578 RepID=UPI002E370A72|nr:TetR/AcrR family transcriptional regulator [Aquabacterium sp.]HEX5357737.1 TetR/AcrR family transcriptional regulator [Aquabacterium sp.]
MTDSVPISRAESNKQRLRADIIEAAFETFSEQGYHQTGIADIARRLGVGHGTFYRYFQNKRDIFEHVVQDVAIKLSQLLVDDNAPAVATSLADYRAQCQRIAQRFMDFGCANPRALRLIMLEATSIDAAMTEQVFKMFGVTGKVTAAYLQNGVAQGFFRPDLDVNASAQVVVGMIQGGVMRYLAAPDDEAGLQRYVDAAIDMLIMGMGQPSTPTSGATPA